LLGVVAKVKNRRQSVKKGAFLRFFKLEIGDGKYSKILNNCTRFESNTVVTVRFN